MADPGRVEAIFEAALDVAPEDLPALLEEECGADAELRKEVEELLALDEEGSVGLLASPVFAFADTVAERVAGTALGAAPKIVGRFAVLEKLGEGGMGVVYAAYDEQLDRKVAIKLLHTARGGSSQVRMLREAQAMARISHPNVMPVYEVGKVGNDLFLAMEFVAGESLNDWMKAEPRSWEAIVDMFVAVGRGLVAAHEAGVVHRDFKPDNVMVGRDGRPRVTDFGLARGLGEEPGEAEEADGSPSSSPLEIKLTRTGAVMGTPRFMSPEQILGSAVDERSDQFSFCIALFQALFGVWPFEGDDLMDLRRNMLSGAMREIPRTENVPAALPVILRRGLAAEPDQRHRTLTVLVDALEGTHRGRHSDQSLGRRSRIVVAATMAALFVLSLVFFDETRRGFQTPREALPPAVFAFVGSVAVALVMRRRLSETSLNREVLWLLLATATFLLANRGAAVVLDAPIASTLASDQLIVTVTLVFGARFVQRGFWWAAAVGTAATLGTLLWPAYATAWAGATLLSALCIAILLWGRPSRPR